LTQGTDGAAVPASEDGTAGFGAAAGAAGAVLAAPDDEPAPDVPDAFEDDVLDDPDTVSEMYFCTADGSTCTASPSSPVS
jgi:hypothetical protein